MSTKTSLLLVILIWGFSWLATNCSLEAQVPHYVLRDLGTLGGTESHASDINEMGQVTGGSFISGDIAEHAFFYSGTSMIDIHSTDLPFTESFANGINNAGQVTGELDHGSGAFLYSGKGMERIIIHGIFGWEMQVFAYALNNAGLVTGQFQAETGWHAFVYSSSDESIIDLDDLIGFDSEGHGINDKGQVVGSCNAYTGDPIAVLYSDGDRINLGTLAGGTQSRGESINNSGQITGWSYCLDSTHAFLYSGTSMIDMGTLGGNESYGHAINDEGQVVGSSLLSGDSIWHGFIYSGTTMIDLNTLLTSGSNWMVTSANGINSKGQIAGNATNLNTGETHAVRLDPVASLTFHRLSDVSQAANPSVPGIDTPIQPVPKANILGALPDFAGGLVADGVTPWIIKLTGAPGVKVEFSFGLSGGHLDGIADIKTLEERLYVLGNGWKHSTQLTFVGTEGFAYLSGIKAEDVHLDQGKTELMVTATAQNAVDSSVLATAQFRIRKPPVILVHGYATSSRTWSTDYKNILATSKGADFVIPIDYGIRGSWPDNTSSALSLLANDLDKKLKDYIENPDLQLFSHWAMTRYDVVAHSQGGVLTRMLCTNKIAGGKPAFCPTSFRSEGNYFRGRFRRIITLGSPQNGSLLLYYLMQADETSGGLLLGTLFPKILGETIQPKFNPWGRQIEEINDKKTFYVDSGAKFHPIITSIDSYKDADIPLFGPPQPYFAGPFVYDLLGLTDGAADAKQFPKTRGTFTLPFGSDGVVDSLYGSGVWATAEHFTSAPIVHANVLPSFFGVLSNQSQTTDPRIAHRIADLLDGSSGAFTSFKIPDLVPTSVRYAIDAHIPTLKKSAIISPAASLAPVGFTSSAINTTNSSSYSFYLTPDATNPIQGKPLWFVEVFGPNGVSEDGVSLQANPTDPNSVTVLVDNSVQGEVVLRSSYNSKMGNIVFGNPVTVVSLPPGSTLVGMGIVPKSASLSAGDELGLEVWVNYDNDTRSLLYLRSESAPQFVSSNPSVVAVDTSGKLKAIREGVATVTATFNGLSAQTAISVEKVTVSSFSPFNGTYSGAGETDPPSNQGAGFISVVLQPNGKFSAGIILAAKRYSITGTFAADGTFLGQVPKTLPALTLNMNLDLSNGTDQLSGAVASGTTLSLFIANRNPFNAKTNPCPQAGKYTFVFDPPQDATQQPQGNGYGTATISPSGAIKFAGSVSDNTKLSQGTILSKLGDWSFYTAPYGGRGSVVGRLTFKDVPKVSDVDGTLHWFKPANLADKYFKGGIAEYLSVAGSKFQSPAKGCSILDLPNTQNNAMLVLGDGGLPSEFSKPITLTTTNIAVISFPGPDKIKLKINVAAGLFSGSYFDTTSGKLRLFNGVFQQKANYGSGFFLGDEQSGFIQISPTQ